MELLLTYSAIRESVLGGRRQVVVQEALHLHAIKLQIPFSLSDVDNCLLIFAMEQSAQVLFTNVTAFSELIGEMMPKPELRTVCKDHHVSWVLPMQTAWK